MKSLIVAFAATANALPIVIPSLLMPSPVDDDFYNPPGDLSALGSGQIYKTRRVDPDLQLKLSLSEVTQIAYKTHGVYGEDSHTVATVLKPLVPSSPPRLFSYQTWEDSANLDCSPSYTLVKGLLSPNALSGILDTTAAIKFAILQGWYVVVPDHEGPRSAFIEGYTQGRAGLDGIRAALDHFNLEKDTPVALYGYSGGASATVWMSNLYESYAPELNIVGAAYGGTPVDIVETVNWLDRPDRMFSGFIVGAFAGLLNAYQDKEKEVWPHLHDSLKNAITDVRTPGRCVPDELLKYGHQEFKTQMDVDFYTFKPFTDIFGRESLFKNASTGILSTPKFPRYMFHARGDEIIPFAAADRYVKEQCASGANIQWVPWKGNDHVSIEYLGIPDAFKFILQAFDNKVPQVQCGTANDDILTLGSKLVGDTIGQAVADFLNAINGFLTPIGRIHFDPNQKPDV